MLRSYFHFIEENLKYFKKRKMDLAQGVNMGVGSEGVSSLIFKSSCFSMPPQLKYSCYQDSSVIRSCFVHLVFGLRKALSWDSMKDAHFTCFQELHPK